MDNLERTLRTNRDWALDRIHKICDTDDPLDYMNAYSIVLEFQEWIDSEEDECDIISFVYKEK
tara:strand:- start:349 stop:537 length:189 start_codon:yes stop_codon:yes gene_type:complete